MCPFHAIARLSRDWVSVPDGSHRVRLSSFADTAPVYLIFGLDIFQSVVAASMGWHIMCAGWGRTNNLVRPGWTFSAIAAVDGISELFFATLHFIEALLLTQRSVAFFVQSFYAWRI